MSTTEIDDGGPAFPCSIDEEGGWYNEEANGMRLRDWFAGQALAGLCAAVDHDYAPSREILANWAYEHADAMIAARKEGLELS